MERDQEYDEIAELNQKGIINVYHGRYKPFILTYADKKKRMFCELKVEKKYHNDYALSRILPINNINEVNVFHYRIAFLGSLFMYKRRHDVRCRKDSRSSQTHRHLPVQGVRRCYSPVHDPALRYL